MRWPNCLTSGAEAFSVASLPSCTSAMPPCAAFSMNLRSLDETSFDGAFIVFGDIALFVGDFIALPLPAAAVVPTLLELCVLAVTCAPTAAAKQNETAPTSAGSEYVRDMGYLRWVAEPRAS